VSDNGTIESRNVGLSLAREIIRRAREVAQGFQISIAVVVVDAADHEVAAERMDHAPFAVLPIAREKAWTAAAFGVPTTVWHESSQHGTPFWGLTTALGGRLSALAGGAPVVLDGKVLGGVGVSGGDAAQDHECATVAADAASSPLPD